MKRIFVFTGPPASGKSSAIAVLKKGFHVQGVDDFYEIAEYGDHIVPWIKANKPPGVYVVDREDYAMMCPEVARSIAGEAVQSLEEVDNIILETARNVGEPNVGYADGFFIPFMDELAKLNRLKGKVGVVNIEVYGGNVNILKKRALNRWNKWNDGGRVGPEPAPVAVLDNYNFDQEGNSNWVADELNRCGLQVSNFLIDNNNGIDGLLQSVEGLIRRLEGQGLIGVEGREMRGKER